VGGQRRELGTADPVLRAQRPATVVVAVQDEHVTAAPPLAEPPGEPRPRCQRAFRPYRPDQQGQRHAAAGEGVDERLDVRESVVRDGQ
jgi:hypothetical protein